MFTFSESLRAELTGSRIGVTTALLTFLNAVAPRLVQQVMSRGGKV